MCSLGALVDRRGRSCIWWVYCAACTAGRRLVLLCLIVLARGSTFVVEQPATSLWAEHPRVRWLFDTVAYVPALALPMCILGFVLIGSAWVPVTQVR